MYSIALKHRSFNSNARKLDSSDYLLEAGYLRLRQIVVKRITANGISIGLAVFAELTHVPNAYADTNHATCDMCSNRSHLCIAYRRCGLKILFRL